MTVLAADGGGEVALDELDRRAAAGPVLWLFGNEARGVPAELAALADARVRIPMRGRAESLNLAAAAAICLYTTQLAQALRGPSAPKARRQTRRARFQSSSDAPPIRPTSRRKATRPADASRSLSAVVRRWPARRPSPPPGPGPTDA